MLKHLSVRNYALIEELEVDFFNGFTVITGETGSGKSVILGALGLVMGDRADFKALKDKDRKCVVEATFQLVKDRYYSFFEDNDLDYDETTLIRREILPGGKSRAFINDTPVNLSQLKEIVGDCLDIHSQHQTILLSNAGFQFNVLDAASEAQKQLKVYRDAFGLYKNLQKELERLQEEEHVANTNKDYYSFLLKDFEAVNINSADLESMEEELKILEHAEEILRVSNEVTDTLDVSDHSILSSLREVKNSLSKLSGVNNTYADFLSRVESVIFELSDINDDVARKADAIEINPSRLEYVSEFLDGIYKLQKKHNVNSIEELVKVKNEIEMKLADISSISDKIEEVQKQLTTQLKETIVLGKDLTRLRVAGTKILENRIREHLKELAMPHAELKVDLIALNEPSFNGMENIEFLVKTNKGSEFELLKKVASGGELSRIMLSIKAILSKNEGMATIIFDEIDTGVGGEVANKMAEIMKQLSSDIQVISITHLAQIASKGNHHYKVLKKVSDNNTTTKIVQLSEEDRLIEIATMLSGDNPSEAALLNAKELMK